MLCFFRPPALEARSVIEIGHSTVWKYWDDPKEPEAAWRTVDFDDSQWKSGQAPLGHGLPGLGTYTAWCTNTSNTFFSIWLRHGFDRPELKPGERLAINICADNGAVIYLNGHELIRANDRPLTAKPTDPRVIGTNGQGFYWRMPVPLEDLCAGRNVLAVEIHSASAQSHAIFFDLGLKTMPPDASAPVVPSSARSVVKMFRKQNYVGPELRIPDGYEDGGHAMKLDAQERPTSTREILIVDRLHDAELARYIAFVHTPELLSLPLLERARRIAIYIDRETTPPGGIRWVDATTFQLEKEVTNKSMLLGDWIEQCHSGVCRHRALLFKILADEAGLRTALVRGHYMASPSSRGAMHVWNELVLDNGQRLLVDVMQKRGKQSLPEVTTSEVIKHYRKLDNAPWYETANGENLPTKNQSSDEQ